MNVMFFFFFGAYSEDILLACNREASVVDNNQSDNFCGLILLSNTTFSRFAHVLIISKDMATTYSIIHQYTNHRSCDVVQSDVPNSNPNKNGNTHVKYHTQNNIIALRTAHSPYSIRSSMAPLIMAPCLQFPATEILKVLQLRLVDSILHMRSKLLCETTEVKTHRKHQQLSTTFLGHKKLPQTCSFHCFYSFASS